MAMQKDKDDADAAERRKGVRLDTENGGAATLEADGRSFRCEIQDVSLRGARIRVLDPLPDSEDVILNHPSAGRLPGRCVWREEGFVGVELDLPERDLERALQCIALALDEEGATL